MGIDWDRVEAENASKRRPRVYSSRVCVRCGRTIQEGAYSGKDGNFKRHVKACDAKGEKR